MDTLELSIDDLDPQSGSDEDLAALHELFAISELEDYPDDPPTPLAEAVGNWRNRSSFRKVRIWRARDGDRVVGLGELSLKYIEQNRHHAYVWVAIRPEWRRKGLAKRLLRPVVAAASEDGRTLLETWASLDGPGDACLTELGAKRAIIDRHSRLLIKDVDAEMLRSWVARAPERAADYSLVEWEGRCPEDLVEAFAELRGVMNTAPREELEEEDEILTPERLRETESTWEAQQWSWWIIAARHDPTGELAGYTELQFSHHRKDRIWQGDTGVVPAHRERGLGRWLKAAMLLRLMERRPEVEKVDTWNAGSNAPMLAINHALGFKLIKELAAWQIGLEELSGRLGD